jgi:hypothetical protein
VKKITDCYQFKSCWSLIQILRAVYQIWTEPKGLGLINFPFPTTPPQLLRHDTYLLKALKLRFGGGSFPLSLGLSNGTLAKMPLVLSRSEYRYLNALETIIILNVESAFTKPDSYWCFHCGSGSSWIRTVYYLLSWIRIRYYIRIRIQQLLN